MILAVNVLVATLSATYWSISAVAAAQLLRQLQLHTTRLLHIYRAEWYRPGVIYGFIAISFIIVLNAQAILSLLWVILAKWIVIRRRRDGRYAWDKSSYCQRWQLHLVLSRFIYKGYGNGGVLAPLTGTVYIVWYLRALGAKIGKDCAIYPGGKAGLMTEPDLVTVSFTFTVLPLLREYSHIRSSETTFLWTTALSSLTSIPAATLPSTV